MGRCWSSSEAYRDKDYVYKYRVTTNSLTTPKNRDSMPGRVAGITRQATGNKVPPSLVKALKRWEVNGDRGAGAVSGHFEGEQARGLEEMRKSKAARFLGEALSPDNGHRQRRSHPKGWRQ